MRTPSPADTRCHLDPAQVDAAAAAYHQHTCRPILGVDLTATDERHLDGDRTHARFMLMTLRDLGWRLIPHTREW